MLKYNYMMKGVNVMKIFLIIVIVLLIIVSGLYAFWLKLLKGKPGRIVGAEVEKKTFEEALVVDVRWRKEYARGHAINAVNLPIKLFKNNSILNFLKISVNYFLEKKFEKQLLYFLSNSVSRG